ncbi:hypothetical protein BDA96_09G125600 [Sorghum bicolor]|uniref:Uncharacterized protein n=1 Tax=Sorghum bicolor TaxID=4558 RepID=A0A921Q9C3_SORBI|nr:hypothetical protein BDA96_09G125600 [Sorghum bicolor]
MAGGRRQKATKTAASILSRSNCCLALHSPPLACRSQRATTSSGFRVPGELASAMKRKSPWSLLCCAAMVVALLLSQQGSQAAYFVPSPGPAPAPTNSSAAPPPPPPAKPNAFPLPMYGVTPGSLQPQECGGRCAARCSATAYRKPCLFFCRKCCATCLCVPAGTYGNKNTCPCYNNWKTKRGGPKCP